MDNGWFLLRWLRCRQTTWQLHDVARVYLVNCTSIPQKGLSEASEPFLPQETGRANPHSKYTVNSRRMQMVNDPHSSQPQRKVSSRPKMRQTQGETWEAPIQRHCLAGRARRGCHTRTHTHRHHSKQGQLKTVEPWAN